MAIISSEALRAFMEGVDTARNGGVAVSDTAPVAVSPASAPATGMTMAPR